jgi:putative membrane protein
MKTRILKPLFVPLFAGLLSTGMMLSSCEQNKDSKDVADEQNKDRFENVNDDNTQSNGTDADRSPNKLEEKDAMFVSDAANMDLAEIYVSREAASRASNADVKRVAKMMVDEHTKSSEQVKALASRFGISLPTQPNENDVKNWKGLLDKRGADFDKDYMDWLVKTHKDAIDKFEDVSKKEDYQPDVRNLATNMLPALRQHLTEAERVRDIVKK